MRYFGFLIVLLFISISTDLSSAQGYFLDKGKQGIGIGGGAGFSKVGRIIGGEIVGSFLGNPDYDLGCSIGSFKSDDEASAAGYWAPHIAWIFKQGPETLPYTVALDLTYQGVFFPAQYVHGVGVSAAVMPNVALSEQTTFQPFVSASTMCVFGELRPLAFKQDMAVGFGTSLFTNSRNDVLHITAGVGYSIEQRIWAFSISGGLIIKTRRGRPAVWTD
jgi:hypothetical protein